MGTREADSQPAVKPNLCAEMRGDVDLLRLLERHAGDRQLLEQLRGDVAGVGGFNLPQLSAHLDDWQAVIDAAELAPRQKKHFTGQLAQLRSDVSGLQDSTTLTRRLLNLAASVACAVPPVMVPIVAGQRQYQALVIALYAKTLTQAAGLAMRPTSDQNVWNNHFRSRHVYNLVQAAEFIVPAFLQGFSKNEAAVRGATLLQRNWGYNVPMALLSSASLFLSYYPRQFSRYMEKMAACCRQPTLHALRDLRDETRAHAEGAMQHADEHRHALSETRRAYVAQGKALTESVYWQFSNLVEHLSEFSEDVGIVLGTARGHRSEEPLEGARRNEDATAKHVLAGLAAVICFAGVGVVFPDTIGMVDLAADATFVTCLMFSMAFDGNKTRQDSMSEFKAFSGLSLVVIGLLGLNLVLHRPIESDDAALGGMTLGLAAANLVLPGPLGIAMGAGAEQLMAFPGKATELAKGGLEKLRGIPVADRVAAINRGIAQLFRSVDRAEIDAEIALSGQIRETDGDGQGRTAAMA